MADRRASGLDPNARLGVRLTLIVVALTIIAVPFGMLLLEVVFKAPRQQMAGGRLRGHPP